MWSETGLPEPTDDEGGRFPMLSGLPKREALRMVSDFESRGHKQLYWIERDPPGDRSGDSRE